MKPAVFSPAARSRSRCNIGSRTRACVPERKIRFASSRYLSSSPTSSNAMMNLARAPCGPFGPDLLEASMHRFGHACPAPGLPNRRISEVHFSLIPLTILRQEACETWLEGDANMKPFDTEISESNGVVTGPGRKPQQMLHAQTYDSHASIHDDATAQKPGFQGGTIEGPTHFSQFAPLCERIWGRQWFETGCLSAHYRNPAFEGEEVQAHIEKPKPGAPVCAIGMTKRDGTEILRGTSSVGGDGSETALSQR